VNIRKAGIWIAASIAVAAAWEVSASAIYCAGMGVWNLFLPPWDQWVIAAPWMGYSPWVTLWLVIGATAPTIMVALCLYGLIRHRLRADRRALYGRSRWAEPGEMRAGGIRQSRSPF
jgi:hypothetical protein